MDVRLCPIDPGNTGMIDRWRDLAARVAEPNPFFEPDFLVPGARADAGEPRLAVAEESGTWHAAIPLQAARWRRGLPVLRTWRGTYGFLGTPLVAGDRPEAAAALISGISEQAGGRSLYLDWMSARFSHGQTSAAFEEAFRHALRETSTFERALLRRREDGEYLSHVKPHHLREGRRLGRRLAQTLGEISVADRAGDADAVSEFLAIERRGWKGRSRTAMGLTDADAKFFAEVCSNFAAASRLQLLELRAGDRVVAMKCNIIAGPGAFAFKIAFDEDFAKFSPGIQLELANIEQFHDSGLEWMDSCADADNQMINRLWTGRRELRSHLLVRKGPVGRTAYRTLKTAIAITGRDR